MKYLLTNFIRLMNGKEMRHYRILNSNFLQKGREKKTIQLLNTLQSEKFDEYDDVIVQQFFNKNRRNSYYRLKNRLLHDLEHSLLSFYKDKDEETMVNNYIRLSDIFIDKTDYGIAEHYLKEAEKLALSHEFYGLLNIIYDKLIQLCHFNSNLDPTPYARQKQVIQQKYEQIQHFNSLLATLTYRLQRSNFSVQEEGVVEMLEAIFEEMQVSVADSRQPVFRLKINQCARQILLQKREFDTLASYLMQSYEEFEKDGVFARHHEEKIIMLIWLVNTLSRIREVDKTVAFTQELGRSITRFDHVFYNKYVWLYYQSETVVRIIQGKPQEAISILEDLLHAEKYRDILSFFSIYLNLSMLYFYEQNIDVCLDYIGKVIVSKDYKSISPHLQLTISILEVVFRIESEDYQFAEARYKDLRRRFSKEIRLPGYTEQKEFLEILRDFINKPDAIKQEKTKGKIEHFVEQYTHFEIGSNELLNYNLWLKSKIKKKPYYQLMLDKYYGTNVGV